MKVAAVSALIFAIPAFSLPSAATFGTRGYQVDELPWAPPHGDDVRGPCPMLNTLTNHFALPHDGKDFSLADVTKGLGVLGMGPEMAKFLHDFALRTNPEKNATTWSLNDLTRHDILEHDGSISRQDAYFGPADVFNQPAWDRTESYFTGDTIDLEMAARARNAAVINSATTNSDHSLSELGRSFGYGETVAYMAVFGQIYPNATETKDMIRTPKNLVNYFFTHERLPFELGWKPAQGGEGLDVSSLGNMIDIMQNISQSVMPKRHELPKSKIYEA